MEWHSTQNEAYLREITSRGASQSLSWCKQVVSLLSEGGLTEEFKVNDFGCQYFQLYKEFDARGLGGIDYFGYDIDPSYLKLGKTLFPKLATSSAQADVTDGNSIREADASIIRQLSNI